MKKVLFLSLSLLCFCRIALAGAPVRQSVAIDRDWSFNYFPAGALDTLVAAPDYHDAAWKAIALPHTWSTYETTGDLHPYIHSASEREDAYWWNGWGWYRKRFVPGAQLRGKRVLVEFDGVQKYARVYLNGVYLGDHKGGHSGFDFDLTPHLEWGKENILAVAVSNRRDDRFGTIPPATAGNYNVYGGIYRSARIAIKNPIHIPFQGSHRHEGGTFITTPEVNALRGVVNVKTWVKNELAERRQVRLESRIIDAQGEQIATLNSTATIAPGELQMIQQQSEPIPSPHLWSPEDPYLYRVLTRVYAGEALVDTLASPLGFRWYRWDDSDNTLIFNDRKIHIHGTNRHQEYPWIGDAMPAWLTLSDMMDIRYGLSTNFMRTAHYPHDPMVYDFNDRHGIITLEEVPNLKPIRFDRQVQEDNMREMVRRDRNHPSIIMWSVGNETSQAADSRWTWQEDTTRIIHERKTEGYGDYVTHHASNLDMENLLRVTIRGWYDKDVRNLEPVNAPGIEKSGQLAGTEEWQHKMARIPEASIRGRLDGQVVAWLYADHGCDRIYQDAPLKNINYKGWVDMYRIPKLMYHLWQANYLESTVLYVHPYRWTERYRGRRVEIQVDSNCDRVELFIDGRKVGEQSPSAANYWTVTFADILVGGTLRAVGTRGEERIEQTLVIPGAPARVVLTAAQGRIPADRSGIDVITADVIDAAGNHVFNFSQPLTWEVVGEGKLVGPGRYTSDIDFTLEKAGTGYVVTPVANLVRSTAVAGPITIRVSAPGLEAGQITIESFAPTLVHDPIAQPALSDAGRVQRIEKQADFREKALYIEELKPVFVPQQIGGSTRDDYAAAMHDYVVSRNPAIDTTSIEFEALIARLADYLAGTSGEFTEDDYNFIAATFNDLRLISRTIENRNFHPDYTAELKRYYTRCMLADNIVVDPVEAVAAIDAIPGELDVLYLRNPEKSKQVLPLQYGNTTYRYSIVAPGLEQAFELLHPTAKLTHALREAIIGMNPGTIDAAGNARFDRAMAFPRNIEPYE